MPDTAQQVEITAALGGLRARRKAYTLARDYYDGRHRLAFATQKFRSAFGELFGALADNLCGLVVDAPADRLSLIGFGRQDAPTRGADAAAARAADPVVKAAWDCWQANRMDRGAGEVHLEALLLGDAYVVVWPDGDGVPRLYPQDGDMATVTYHQERRGWITRAAKAWLGDPDGKVYLTLYYPDRIEKYVTRNKPTAAQLPETPGDFLEREVTGEAWPLPNDYGQVPVFHFANNGRTGRFGRSELGDVIPLQDALNKELADHLVAGEYVALPQRWAVGLEVENDPETGSPRVPFTPGVERVWAVANEAVKFGEFAGADLSQFIAGEDALRTEIARVSRTPLHYIVPQTGHAPSGAALRTAEAPFLAKVADRQAAFGNVWEDVMEFALRVGGQTEPVKLEALWADPAPRVELEHAQTEQLKSTLGVSERQILRELGYSDEQIEAMQTEKTAEIARRQQLAQSDMLSAGLTQDGAPPPVGAAAAAGGAPNGTA